jgi:hypothetical protein
MASLGLLRTGDSWLLIAGEARRHLRRLAPVLSRRRLLSRRVLSPEARRLGKSSFVGGKFHGLPRRKSYVTRTTAHGATGRPPPRALAEAGPVVGHPSRPRRLHAPFHQAVNRGGAILLRAAGRPASATRWPNSNRPASTGGGATTARRGSLPRLATSGLRRPGSRRRSAGRRGWPAWTN